MVFFLLFFLISPTTLVLSFSMQLWLSANLICIVIQYADLSLMSFGDKMCSIMMYCILYWEMILGISGYGILVISLSPCVVRCSSVTWRETTCLDCCHSCSMSPSESGRPGLRSHWFRQDVGILSPAARPPAAAGQSGLQSRRHLPHQRAGQPGTRNQQQHVDWTQVVYCDSCL